MEIHLKYRKISQTNWESVSIDPKSYFEPLNEGEEEFTWNSVPLHLSLKDYILEQADDIQEALLVIEENGQQLLYTMEYYWMKHNYLIHRIEKDLELLILQVTEPANSYEIIHTLRVNMFDKDYTKIEYIKIINEIPQRIDHSYSFEFSKMKNEINNTIGIRNSDLTNIGTVDNFVKDVLFATPLCHINFSHYLHAYLGKNNTTSANWVDGFFTLNSDSFFRHLSWGGNNFVKYRDNEILVFIFGISISKNVNYNIRIAQDIETKIIKKLEEDFCKII